MGLIDFIGDRVLPERKRLRETLAGLRDVPAGRAGEELLLAVHDLCVTYASDFVRQERTRRDSPFVRADSGQFFHEILILNYWLAGTVLRGETPVSRKALSGAYLRSSHCRSSETDETLVERYKAYSESWDELSGTQDRFAVQAAMRIFRSDQQYAENQVSFWLISHTFETLKRFENVKRLIGELRLFGRR